MHICEKQSQRHTISACDQISPYECIPASSHVSSRFQRHGSKFASELDLLFGTPFHNPTPFPTHAASSGSGSSRPSSLLAYSNGPKTSFGPTAREYGPTARKFGPTQREYSSRRDFPATNYDGRDAPQNVAWVSPNNYTREDTIVSETLMKLWTTFAHTGWVKCRYLLFLIPSFWLRFFSWFFFNARYFVSLFSFFFVQERFHGAPLLLMLDGYLFYYFQVLVGVFFMI